MNNVIDIATGAPLITNQHRRIADKIEALVRAEVPDAINIRVESIETICVCVYRDQLGDAVCLECPENPCTRLPDPGSAA